MFLLSISEVYKFLPIIKSDKNLGSFWWLRSPGRDQASAAYYGKSTAFDETEQIQEWGSRVNEHYSVRPAM